MAMQRGWIMSTGEQPSLLDVYPIFQKAKGPLARAFLVHDS
jgi:hypothetical protein